MEYEILQKIQAVPRWIRIIFGVIFLSGGMVAALLPLIPGGIIGIPLGLLLLVSARKVQKVRKIRRGLQHLFQNASWQRIQQKFYDVKTHLKHIIFRNK